MQNGGVAVRGIPFVIGITVGLAVAAIIASLVVDFYRRPNNKR